MQLDEVPTACWDLLCKSCVFRGQGTEAQCNKGTTIWFDRWQNGLTYFQILTVLPLSFAHKCHAWCSKVAGLLCSGSLAATSGFFRWQDDASLCTQTGWRISQLKFWTSSAVRAHQVALAGPNRCCPSENNCSLDLTRLATMSVLSRCNPMLIQKWRETHHDKSCTKEISQNRRGYVCCVHVCFFGAYVSLFVSFLQLLWMYVCMYVLLLFMYYYKFCSMQCACL